MPWLDSVGKWVGDFLLLLVATGGPVGVWLTTRGKGDKVPAAEARQAQAKAIAEDSGLAGEWRRYAAEMRDDAERAERRAARQAKDAREREARHLRQIKTHYSYAIDLRDHINLGKPPPPPPWPPEIDPSHLDREAETPTQGD